MQFGLVISVLLHVALIGWAVITIHSQRELRVAEPEPVAVDLITPGELTKLRQGVRTAKHMEAEPKESPKPDAAKKEAPKPAPQASAPPPPAPEPPKEEVKAEPPKPADPPKDPIAEKLAAAPPVPAAPAVPPEPALEQQKLEEKIIEEQRKAEEAKRLEEQKKAAELKKKQEEAKKKREAELRKKREEEKRRKEAEAKKKQFDAEKISALLNKIPDKGAPPASAPPSEPTKNKGPVLGAPDGRDKQLSASEVAILGQIIRSCVQTKWNILGGGETAQHTEVKMRLRFNPDGRLSAPPQVTNQQNTPYFLAVSDSAVRAVQACEPFPLPAPKYEYWKDMILTFKPTDMF
ncbi:MAG: cell envelope integrity protein TolA [Hyphomicrobiaceae bacterium]|nr:MAG: cell envelope integrity protein TolA [Hyphomicrobiaceae bacterium]